VLEIIVGMLPHCFISVAVDCSVMPARPEVLMSLLPLPRTTAAVTTAHHRYQQCCSLSYLVSSFSFYSLTRLTYLHDMLQVCDEESTHVATVLRHLRCAAAKLTVVWQLGSAAHSQLLAAVAFKANAVMRATRATLDSAAYTC
jgi:hypothetical protein